MRDDDEDDFNGGAGNNESDIESAESLVGDDGDGDGDLSEDGLKLKQQMIDAQARISEGKPLLNYQIMVDDEEEEEVKQQDKSKMS